MPCAQPSLMAHFAALPQINMIESSIPTPRKKPSKPGLGRPAKACLTCRKRKVKCDLRVPCCGSCEQNGWQCDGVKNTPAYKFRNENAKTRRRAETNLARQYDPVEASTRLEKVESVVSAPFSTLITKKAHQRLQVLPLETEECKSSNVQRVWHPAEPIMGIGVGVDELSIAYFFTAYTYGWIGQPVNVTDGNGCLIASIKALGLAGLSRFDSEGRLSLRVHSQYLEAVTLANAALQSPDYIRRDSTLLAVYILSIFETTVGVHKSSHRWREHIKGAASLLYVRGADQFRTSTGGRLFSQIAVSLAISCIQERIALPDHFRSIMHEARRSLPQADHALWRFCELGFRFVDLYASLSPRNFPTSQVNAEETLQEACEIDAALSTFYERLPFSWSYERIETDDPVAITGYYHIYRTSLIASALNALRCMRIFLSDIMLKAFELCPTTIKLQLSPSQMQRVRESPWIVKSSLLDILASVPQHLSNSLENSTRGFLPFNDAVPPGPADHVWENFRSMDVNPWQDLPTSSIDLPRVRLAGGFLLQWSLFVAGILYRSDNALRTWIIKVLHTLGNDVGMKHALELASQLEATGSASLHPLLPTHFTETHLPYSDVPPDVVST